MLINSQSAKSTMFVAYLQKYFAPGPNKFCDCYCIGNDLAQVACTASTSARVKVVYAEVPVISADIAMKSLHGLLRKRTERLNQLNSMQYSVIDIVQARDCEKLGTKMCYGSNCDLICSVSCRSKAMRK